MKFKTSKIFLCGGAQKSVLTLWRSESPYSMWSSAAMHKCSGMYDHAYMEEHSYPFGHSDTNDEKLCQYTRRGLLLPKAKSVAQQEGKDALKQWNPCSATTGRNVALSKGKTACHSEHLKKRMGTHCQQAIRPCEANVGGIQCSRGGEGGSKITLQRLLDQNTQACKNGQSPHIPLFEAHLRTIPPRVKIMV